MRPADPIDEYTGVVPPKHGREWYEGGIEALNEFVDLWLKSDMSWKQSWETMMEHVQGHLAALPPDPDDEPQPYPTTRPSGTITVKLSNGGRAIMLPVEEEDDPRDEALRLAIAAIEKAESVFRAYEIIHRAKPDHEKADSNLRMAEAMTAALTAIKAVRG